MLPQPTQPYSTAVPPLLTLSPSGLPTLVLCPQHRLRALLVHGTQVVCYLCRSGPTTTFDDLHLVCPTVVAVARLLSLEFLDVSPRYASWTQPMTHALDSAHDTCLHMLPALHQ